MLVFLDPHSIPLRLHYSILLKGYKKKQKMLKTFFAFNQSKYLTSINN